MTRLCSVDDEAAADIVLRARLNGMSVDMVYLGLLAGAARRLGERWDEDRTTSAQMTIAAGRIYAIMRGLRQAFTSDHYLTRRRSMPCSCRRPAKRIRLA